MSDASVPREAHVVVAAASDDPTGIGPKLFAVISETPEQAEAAVQAVVPPGEIVTATGGPLKPETVERLEIVAGEAKQIG